MEIGRSWIHFSAGQKASTSARENLATDRARRALLFRRRRQRDVADGQLELFGVQPAPGLSPESRRELQIAVTGPVGHDPNDVREVALGIEAVQLTGGDEGEDVGGSLGVVVSTQCTDGSATRTAG